MEDKRHDANTLCRTCLENLSEDASDTITKHDIFLMPDTAKKLVLCTSLAVEPHDGYPKHLCDCCYTKVNEFHQFQKMCVKSAQRYGELLLLERKAEAGDLSFEDEQPFCDLETKVEIDEMDVLLQSDNDRLQLKEFHDAGPKNRKKQKRHSPKVNEVETKSKKSLRKSANAQKEKEPKQSEEKSGAGVANQIADYADSDGNEEENVTQEDSGDQDEKPLKTRLKKTIAKKCKKTSPKTKSDDKNTTRHYCTEPGCDRSYTQKQSVNLHLRLHHKIGPEIPSHICEICGKSFKFLRNLNDHRYTHRDKSELPFPCELAPDCQRRFAKRDKLKDHMMRHAGIKNHVCPICGLRKVTGNELKSHMNYHTLERTWPCHLCAYISKNAGNLKVHMRKIHGMSDNGEKPYACAECGKSFNHPAALGSHEKIHQRKPGKAQSDQQQV